MYQVAAIDTSQITPVTASVVPSTLPEVTAVGVAAQKPLGIVLRVAPSSIHLPLSVTNSQITTATAPEVSGEVPLTTSDWPSISTMIQALQERGILNPELGSPLLAVPPINHPPVATQDPNPAVVITLANTSMTFERPSADYILNQADSGFKLPWSLILSLVGLALIIGLVTAMYLHLQSQGLTQAEIMQTGLDALRLSR